MDWFIVLSLLGLGLLLILAEIIFIPGTTVVGIFGLILSVSGLYSAFHYFGSTTGTIILMVFLIISGFVFYKSFKGNIWLKFALNKQNSGKAKEDNLLNLMPGMMGKTISALRPFGTAEFENQYFEVHSQEGYLDRDVTVRIHKIENNIIFVETINS